MPIAPCSIATTWPSPKTTLPRNPHLFNQIEQFGAIALAVQNQSAAFFASDGQEVIHPQPKRFFEVGLKELPEDLNYIP